jgi:transposase-like protein
VELVGPNGLTKTVLEAALEAELSDHLGHDNHDSAGRNGGYSRQRGTDQDGADPGRSGRGGRARDRDGTFEPVIVRKRQRRLDGSDPAVCVGGSEVEQHVWQRASC